MNPKTKTDTEEKLRSEIEKAVSKEIPYSKKKCIDMAYETGFQAGQKEALSGKNCVKLVEQGKEIGKQSATSDELRFLESLPTHFGFASSYQRKRIEERIQKLKEQEKDEKHN